MANLEKFNNRQSFSAENKRMPELLAPVADVEMLQAAIHNGADAVYIGMPGHNARARSEDLSWDKLSEMIQLAHVHQVKVLIAFNILIFEDEIRNLENNLHQLALLKPDAIIAQDLGLCYLLKEMYPTLPVHASTQMTHTSSLGINLLKDLNLKRVVLGREVSIQEMKSIRSNTNIELEVFVHGALCVAYSGQCLTSESFGGRSANRGQCAQSCRLDYQLMVDGQEKKMNGVQNLVSPKDLCGLDDLPELIDLGIDSFKIEGRYKSSEYVGLTSKMYRQKINDFNAEQSKTDLEIMFSRGFFSGWYHGVNHKKLVEGKSSSHRGAKIGQVSKVIHRPNPSLIIETNQPIHKGDGLLILNTFDQPSASGKAYHVEKNGPKHLKIEFSNELSFQHVKQGDEVFINSSDFRDQQIKLSWRDKRLHKKIPISCQFSGKLNQALQLQVKCDDLELKLFSQSELSSAKKKPLQKSDLIEEFKKLAGTVYQLKELTCELDESLFIPAKELKQLRQQMTSSLDEHRLQRPNHNLYRPYAKVITTSKPPTLSKTQSSLHVLIREPDQINELNPKLVEKISLDFKHGTAYGPSIKKIKQMGIMAGIATTRILKENQTRRLNNLKKHQPDFILVRNLGALNFLHQNADLSHIPKIGDFSLNVTNHLSSFYLFNKGLDLICPSYDLNRQQLMTLLQNCTPNRYEITIHQYMPSFHMEHCVFATFLSDGTNAQNCGMVCRDHQVSLKDHKGIEHPLQADQECRNTMFNGKAQSAANLIPELLQLGVTNFRIEALNESSTDIATKLEHYQKVINGSLNPDILKNLLGLEEKYGISEGQLLNNRTYKDRKKTQ